MPNIKSSTDLRNNYNDISTFCRESREPVFITKNGQGDLAVMSIEAYERGRFQDEVYHMLMESTLESENDPVLLTHEEVFGKLRADLAKRLEIANEPV